MKNEIKIRKRRFIATILTFILLLNQLPPISVDAAEYAVEDLVYNQILTPGDKILNNSDTSYTITYSDDEETEEKLSSGTIEQNGSHTVPGYTGTIPDGFVFAGWKVCSLEYNSNETLESIGLQATISINGTEITETLKETILKPKTVLFNEDTLYTITYYDQDGTTVLIDAQGIPVNTAHEVSGYEPPTGYEFVGWKVSYVYASSGEGTINLIAQLALNQYTITFDTDGGSAVDAIKAEYGAAVTAPADPIREGYTFAGWDQTIPTTMPAEDVTITAQWNVNQYTITFDTDGGSEIASITQDYGTAVASPANPTKAGYTFAGWDKTIPTTMPADDMTITAQWDVNKYTIKFVNEDSTPLQSIEVAYDEMPVYSGETPTKAATAQYTYTFAGWTPEITAVTGEATYTATYTAETNKYTIKFVDEDGTELQSSAVAYGEMPVYDGIIPTKAATAEHTYTFDGWTPAITAVTGDATYTATYTETANQYMITFDTAGGSSVAPITQAYGTAVTAPDAPARTGYSFANWVPEIPATMPAENMTIIAQWNVNQYTITFDTDGGSEIASITQDYGTTVNAPANPTKSGYTFAGWDKAIPATMPEENLTVTAKWTPYVIDAGTYDLKQGAEYKLGDGVTKVNDDTSEYVSGSTFYVSKDGSYTFS